MQHFGDCEVCTLQTYSKLINDEKDAVCLNKQKPSTSINLMDYRGKRNPYLRTRKLKSTEIIQKNI